MNNRNTKKPIGNINVKLNKLLAKQNKSVYGLAKHLGITSQAGYYLVDKKKLEEDYIRLQKIAEYLDCKIEDVVDIPESDI